MCLDQLGQEHAARAAFGRRCATCQGWHGGLAAPAQPWLGLAVAHLPGYVAAIAGTGIVGVDVAAANPDEETVAAILSEAATPAERRAIHQPLDAVRVWARKECLTKAGIAAPGDWTATNAGELAPATGRRAAPAARFAEVVADGHLVVALALDAPVHLRIELP